MSKPWDELWDIDRLHAATVITRDRERLPHYLVRVAYFEDSRDMVPVGCDDARAKLAAAAPTMARLLCRLEWSGCCIADYDEHEPDAACPSCAELPGVGHAPDCHLDAALSAAGIDAAERERVRGG